MTSENVSAPTTEDTTAQPEAQAVALQADSTAVDEILDGYSVSMPESTATIVDPVSGRYTFEVIQDNASGVTYVFSIDETVDTDNLLLSDTGAKTIYMTRFKDGSVVSTDTIDRSAAEGTRLTYDNTEVVIITGQTIQIGSTDNSGTYKVLYNAVSAPSGQDVSTVNILVQLKKLIK